MINLDPEIRKYLLYQVSETFAEIRKFVEFKQYDHKKTISGLQELCALFNLKLASKEEDRQEEYLLCTQCGRRKLKRLTSPYCYRCVQKINHQKQMQDFKITKLEDV